MHCVKECPWWSVSLHLGDPLPLCLRTEARQEGPPDLFPCPPCLVWTAASHPNLSLPAPLHTAQPPHPGRADICLILRIPATPAVCCAVRKPRSIFHPRGQGSYTKPAQGDQHCGGAAGMRPAKPWPQPQGSAGQTEHTSQKRMRARHVCQPLPGQSH